MLSNLGNILIIFTVLISGLIINYSVSFLRNNDTTVPKKIFYLSLYQTTLIIVCFATLITGFILSDFSLITLKLKM